MLLPKGAIPPGARRYEVRASWTDPGPRPGRQSGHAAHALLGREMSVTAMYPDGTTRPLIYIDDWDFNW